MGNPILEIVVLDEDHRIKRGTFSVLSESIQGWGIEQLHFCSTDALALEKTRNFGS